MTTADLVLLAVLGVSALFGLMRGFIGVLASLVAWVLAGWIAFRFGGRIALLLSGGAAPSAMQLFGGHALGFLGVLVVVGLLAWMLCRLVKSIGLSGADRALGFALGVARGGFVACLLVLLMGFTSLPREASWRESQVIPVLVPGAEWMRGWLPPWAGARVDFGRGGPMSLDGIPPIEGGAFALPVPAGA